ncbi:MAG: hypothetical protein UIM24_05820 [Clostridia bacterium]|nr:hypothetical protein [Clostridia bacterium]
MLKKISAIICVVLVVTSLTSCGKYAKLYETLDGLVVETVFPEASSGATTIKQAGTSVYIQQKALCEAMAEAYNLTDIESLRSKHPEINRNKMMAELSTKRQYMNDTSASTFVENMNIILDKVDDGDKSLYISKCLEEVKGFYKDYDKLVKADADDYKNVSKIFVSYAFSKNELAKKVILEHSDFITEAATRTIEENAEEDSSFRANISKNNEIIKAINEVLGGVSANESYRTRINKANRKLLVKTLGSMRSMSQAERDSILKQFEEA